MTPEQVDPTSIKILPEWFWRIDRLEQLSKAMRARIKHDTGGLYIETPIPNEWFTEFGEHIQWLSKNKPEQLIDFIYGT